MRLRRTLLVTAAIAWWTGRPPAAEFEWNPASPASQGVDAARLQALQDELQRRQTKALLVIRNDRMVWEWYAAGHGPDTPHYTASMAKALVGGVATAVAIGDGRIRLDDLATRYAPQWRSDPFRSRITLRHLGSHTSGLADAEADGLPHDELTGWQGDFWKRLPPPGDAFTISRDRAPVLFPPGASFQYSNPGMAMLAYALTVALKDAPQKDIRTLLRDRVMRPLGVPDEEWSVGYGKTYAVDGLPLVAPWGGGSYTARATARVGRLMLRGGEWEGRRLLGAEAVRAVTTDAGTPGHGGAGWWSNAEGRFEGLPRDAFWGSGAGHQVLLVVPSLDLVAVRNGGPLDASLEHHAALHTYLFRPLVEAVIGAAPYPLSPVIAGIDWAPADAIVRRAPGGDNWPITWGDDDRQYTAYGDGRGFEPFVERKLSLGLAVVSGGPEDFEGLNLRSPDVEFVGDGPAGRKASGILMVDGVLYLWARNAANSQLATSRDRGRTWTWADWKFTTSFGCPTFLQFGRDHAGTPDDYVYVYSFDSDSAYEAADRMVLARVPKDRIMELGAYEFFAGLDGKDEPKWSRDLAGRAAVFEHPGRCYRLNVSYHPALKRYLLVQTLPESRHPQGPRFEGGLGVFDALRPWGPWTTAFFTEHWDTGPGESASFPTKWMRGDGRTLYLVFSGNDAFSVRRATLRLKDQEAKSASAVAP